MQYKARLIIVIHESRKRDTTRPCHTTLRAVPYRLIPFRDLHINSILFLFKGLMPQFQIFPSSVVRPEILRFTANYPSKIFVAQIYKFYFQQKAKGLFFFIFICIWSQNAQNIRYLGQGIKKAERQPDGCRSDIYRARRLDYRVSSVLRASIISVFCGSNSSILFQ